MIEVVQVQPKRGVAERFCDGLRVILGTGCHHGYSECVIVNLRMRHSTKRNINYHNMMCYTMPLTADSSERGTVSNTTSSVSTEFAIRVGAGPSVCGRNSEDKK